MNNTSIEVLLVEDDPLVQKVHIKMLEKLGCIVDLAENGEQAITKFSKGYHLIFMDIGLPDISGITVITQIRACEHGATHTPIIVLTGYTQEEFKKQCLGVGADAVFTKPTHLNLFQTILYDYLNYSGNIKNLEE